MGLSHVGFRAAKPATEEDEPDPLSAGIARAKTEETVEALASLGVRATMVRLAPSVHGDGDTGLVPQLIGIARKKGRFAYVGDGQNRWPAVHRRDAARLFRLALEKGVAGARYHGVAEEGIPFRSIAEIIGRQLNIPVESISAKDAARSFSWFGDFAATDNPSSSRSHPEPAGLGTHPTRAARRPQRAGLLCQQVVGKSQSNRDEEKMPLVSITRFRARAWWLVPMFALSCPAQHLADTQRAGVYVAGAPERQEPRVLDDDACGRMSTP